ncbi:MAG: metallophosphoesterase [bacterium]
MMVASIADTHLTETPHPGGYSLEEQVAQLIWIGEDAAKRGALAMLHGGDLFDGANGSRPSTPAERNAAIKVVTAWAEMTQVAIVRGNHDHAGDLLFLGRLRTRHPVVVFDAPATVTMLSGQIQVACLPWPRKAHLATWSGIKSGPDLNAALVAGLRSVLGGLSEWGPGAVKVLLAHAELGSAVLDNGQPVIGRCDVALGESDLLGVGADVVLLGHIHRHQVLADGRICYAGAPRPNKFGEVGPHGYCLVDVEPGGVPSIEHISAPGRKMVTIDAEWIGRDLTCDGDGIVDVDLFDGIPDMGGLSGQSVRLAYEVDESEREIAKVKAEEIRAKLLAAGAHSVKIVPTIKTTQRVRSRAMVAAATSEDRLRAYWESRGASPTREQSIIEKLAEIEEVTP